MEKGGLKIAATLAVGIAITAHQGQMQSASKPVKQVQVFVTPYKPINQSSKDAMVARLVRNGYTKIENPKDLQSAIITCKQNSGALGTIEIQGANSLELFGRCANLRRR